MFNLNMMHSCVYNGAYGLANIGISNFDVALCYIVAIVVSIIVALILRFAHYCQVNHICILLM